MKRASALLLAFAAMTALPILDACSVTTDAEQDYPKYDSRRIERKRIEKLEHGNETVFGELSIGGSSDKKGEAAPTSTVNLYLWRAALETLSLGPLASADPFGGVIITDWFTLQDEPGSEYRATAYILGRELRTDNIRVALYVRDDKSGVARRATPEAETRLENLILTKARTIRATQYR